MKLSECMSPASNSDGDIVAMRSGTHNVRNPREWNEQKRPAEVLHYWARIGGRKNAKKKITTGYGKMKPPIAILDNVDRLYVLNRIKVQIPPNGACADSDAFDCGFCIGRIHVPILGWSVAGV